MKVLKAVFTIISVICIAFTCFFAYSYLTGNTTPLAILGHQIAKLGGKSTTASSGSTSSAVSTLTNNYGLSSSQASQVVDLAASLGVDTSNPAEVDSFIAKNIDKVDDAQALADAVGAGEMSEAEAYARLAGMLNV